MGKEVNDSPFLQRRAKEMPDDRPFVVPNFGYFVWVRPPFIEGQPNKGGRRRVLCIIQTDRNGGGARLCAVQLKDKVRVQQIEWQDAVALSGLKAAFGVSKRPEVYIEEVPTEDPEKPVRTLHFLREKEKAVVVQQ